VPIKERDCLHEPRTRPENEDGTSTASVLEASLMNEMADGPQHV